MLDYTLAVLEVNEWLQNLYFYHKKPALQQYLDFYCKKHALQQYVESTALLKTHEASKANVRLSTCCASSQCMASKSRFILQEAYLAAQQVKAAALLNTDRQSGENARLCTCNASSQCIASKP